MRTVREILSGKGYDVYSVSPDDTIFNALKLMAEKKIGAVLVMEKGEVVGIMSERDYARKVVLEGKSSRDSAVRDIMSEKVIYVDTDRQVEECMALMIEKRIRHLPVFEENKLSGNNLHRRCSKSCNRRERIRNKPARSLHKKHSRDHRGFT